ncbi:hypothetical protein [uncultured Corynebacterium sp.]|uniref:8-oxoguanine DNA glycosylase OGG fold protein n=1 Tax=uncultured Corynebacterium sp. TaxID=159447 RepID=UPI0025D58AF9|nr:hypothetical protein [uncultured Corynebacterium sp.]
MFPTAARIYSVVERAASSFSYEDVLNHHVAFDAAGWRTAWSQHPHLGPPPAVFDTDSSRGTLTRRQVFAAAERLDSPAEILSFFATLAAWGTGTKGLMRYRVMTPRTPWRRTAISTTATPAAGGACPGWARRISPSCCISATRRAPARSPH